MKGKELNSMIFLGPFQIRIFSDSMKHECAANRGLGEFGVPYQSKNLSIKLVFALCFIKTLHITRYCCKSKGKRKAPLIPSLKDYRVMRDSLLPWARSTQMTPKENLFRI